MDDVKFDRVLRYPKYYAPLMQQYKQALSPDSSLYTNMPLAKQIDSVFRRRYCSACWQSQGITVIPAVGWGDERSFEFCFDGIEQGAVVAVSALGSKKIKEPWLAGFKTMCEIIHPDKVICYCSPFSQVFQMADVLVVPHEGITANRKRYRERQKDLPGLLDDSFREIG
jgi:hypothetical protein